MSHRATPANTAELTAEIVSAYVSNNETAPSDVAALITVAGQLSRIGTAPEPVEVEKPKPAVPIRRSIQRDHLLCLVCGKPQKVLKRHLAVQHELTPAQYRERFGLKPTTRWRHRATSSGDGKSPSRPDWVG